MEIEFEFFKTRLGLFVLIILVFLPGIMVVVSGIENSGVLLATDALLVPLSWGALRLRDSGWREVGFRKPENIKKLIGTILGVTILLVIISNLLRPVIYELAGEMPDLKAFEQIQGNIPALLGGLVVVWTIAAFGEELVFRGFLMNAIYELFPDDTGDTVKWITALLVSSTAFGFAHTYQGNYGIIMTGIIGLGFGALYLANRRNLWYSILTHGLYDTIGFVLVYLGINPNMEMVKNIF